MRVKITHLIDGKLLKEDELNTTYGINKLSKIKTQVDNKLIMENMNHSFPNCKFNKNYEIQIDLLEDEDEG